MAESKLAELKKFFSTPEKPLSIADFKAEWDQLSDEEKQWFREQDLTAQ